MAGAQKQQGWRCSRDGVAGVTGAGQQERRGWCCWRCSRAGVAGVAGVAAGATRLALDSTAASFNSTSSWLLPSVLAGSVGCVETEPEQMLHSLHVLALPSPHLTLGPVKGCML